MLFRSIEGITGKNNKEEIISKLSKYGISYSQQANVEIWGTGAPLREFLWSEEMADACIYIMENVDFKDLTKKSAGNQSDEIRNKHINIGTGEEITIKNLAFLIKEIIGYTGNLEFNTSKPDGTMRKLTNPSKLHNLGWHHKIEIEEGIKKLFNWYIDN